MKQYVYTPKQDAALDAEFSGAAVYGRVKLGGGALFWKSGLKWYTIPLARVRRIYRRVEFVYGKLCLGGSSYDIQRLVLVPENGAELEILIGDRMEKQAIALMDALQTAHPEIQYGKA